MVDYDKARDCEHGRQIGKCGDCEYQDLLGELSDLRAERDALKAEIEAARKQEPDSWRVTSPRFCGTHTTDKEIADHWMKIGEAYPLYASPVPAQQLPADLQSLESVGFVEVDGARVMANVYCPGLPNGKHTLYIKKAEI